jgi:hypothetical protein
MIAILKDALECLTKYAARRVVQDVVIIRMPWSRVEDKSTDWLFSFNNICDLLGFDPDYLRQILLKKRRQIRDPARAKIYSFPIVTGQV